MLLKAPHYSSSAAFVVCLFLVGCNAFGRGPLHNAYNRPTPLHFGLYVTSDPKHNPIDPPERFAGYHAGLDFEIDPSEKDVDVPVYAICEGTVIFSGFAQGYGGLLIHRCKFQEQDVTVLYGHLKVEGLPEIASTVHPGDQIGVLGADRSRDTDGNRKHLHFAIHKGRQEVMLGYVQTPEELDQFLDPSVVLTGSEPNGPVKYEDPVVSE